MVNTVALTLFEIDSAVSMTHLLIFLAVIALVTVAVDRRSFLVAGIGYVVALAFIVLEDRAGFAILALGLGLVLLGATWEKLRGKLMDTLPAFPGKNNLPPWVSNSVE